MQPGHGWLLVSLLCAIACHRPREMAPQIPASGIDGKYSFTISQPFKLEGRFLVTYSKAYMIAPKRCRPIEGPKASPAMRASWFECSGSDRPSAANLRLRISEVDPVSQSRWYQRISVPDTVVRCTQYQDGRCVQGFRGIRRERNWVDRSGSITVVRGWPAVPDTSAAPAPAGRRPLRVRCDTSAAGSSCAPNDSREAR